MSYQIVTKQGNRRDLPYLFAVGSGLWIFPFFGETTYIDPYDSSIWTWENVTNDVDEILAVFYEDSALIQTFSINDCRIQDGSFFWDDVNGYLYIHWFNYWDDFYPSRNVISLSQIIAGFANGYSRTSFNIYDGVFYNPIILDLSGFSKKADLTKFGLISYDKSSITLTDQGNNLYNQDPKNAVGIPLHVYLIEKDATELTIDDRIFTGIYNGYKHNRESIQYEIIETRFFNNNPVCKNILSLDDWPDIGDNEGELIPVAWGKIRRGIMLLLNEEGLEEETEGTAYFIVSDPALGAILAITNIYNETGIAQTITAVNLTMCIVEVTKPADISPGDLKNWTWEGQGYDIPGNYNNGLDIIKQAYFVYANISFLSSTFDVGKWNTETSINVQSIGLSIQSEKGFIEEIIEPITTSLQGVVEIMGNGKITWSRRDISLIPLDFIPIIKAYDQINIPEIDLDVSETVSELQVQYSPDFKKKEYLSYVYTEKRNEVIKNYGINRRDPISPVKTVLTEKIDAQALAVEIMQTSANPIRKISVTTIDLLRNIHIFGIIGMDTGDFRNENIEFGELLSIDPNYNEFTHTVTMRVIPDYDPQYYLLGQGFSDREINLISIGYSDRYLNDVSSGYGYTHSPY